MKIALTFKGMRVSHISLLLIPMYILSLSGRVVSRSILTSFLVSVKIFGSFYCTLPLTERHAALFTLCAHASDISNGSFKLTLSVPLSLNSFLYLSGKIGLVTISIANSCIAIFQTITVLTHLYVTDEHRKFEKNIILSVKWRITCM